MDTNHASEILKTDDILCVLSLEEQTYQITAVQVLSPAKAKLEQGAPHLQQYAVLTDDESVYDDRKGLIKR